MIIHYTSNVRTHTHFSSLNFCALLPYGPKRRYLFYCLTFLVRGYPHFEFVQFTDVLELCYRNQVGSIEEGPHLELPAIIRVVDHLLPVFRCHQWLFWFEDISEYPPKMFSYVQRTGWRIFFAKREVLEGHGRRNPFATHSRVHQETRVAQKCSRRHGGQAACFL